MELKVHFDGKVFVPDEPVNLHAGAVGTVVFENNQPLATGPSQPAADASKHPSLVEPLIVGLDPDIARSIGDDPEFDIENS